MGIVVDICSLEEMCDLMCNNTLPRRRKAKKKNKQERKENDRKSNREDRADGKTVYHGH